MPAYYIDSGNLNIKVVAQTPYKACILALEKYLQPEKIIKLAPIMLVNERGNSRVTKDTVMCLTSQVILDSNLDGKYYIDRAILAKMDEGVNHVFKKMEENKKDKDTWEIGQSGWMDEIF